MIKRNRLCVVAITKNGSDLARLIKDRWPAEVDLYLQGRFILPGDGASPLGEDLKSEVGRMFGAYTGIVFIMATGVVVRMIAPFLQGKTKDPAVVVVDEKGRFAISLLSGHIGGANRLAEDISALIGGTPVITTASDVQGTLAVDMLAQKLDCAIDDMEAAKTVTAAIVNGENIGVYAQGGFKRIIDAIGPLPANFFDLGDESIIDGPDISAAIFITPFLNSVDIGMSLNVSFLRPRRLCVGLGCNRGTSVKEIEKLFHDTLNENALSPLSVRYIASIEEKSDEEGILLFAEMHGYELKFFSKEQLREAGTPSGPSEAVYRNMGVYGVCEPAAMLAAGVKALLVPKKKSLNATIAVALAD